MGTLAPCLPGIPGMPRSPWKEKPREKDQTQHYGPTSSGNPAMAATTWATSPSSVTPSCRKTRVTSVEEKERDEEEDGGLK